MHGFLGNKPYLIFVKVSQHVAEAQQGGGSLDFLNGEDAPPFSLLVLYK